MAPIPQIRSEGFAYLYLQPHDSQHSRKNILVWWSKQVRYFICKIQMFILALSSLEAILKTT